MVEVRVVLEIDGRSSCGLEMDGGSSCGSRNGWWKFVCSTN